MAEKTTSSRAPDPPRDVLGRPLDDLRISVIDRCNFRCTFCMPAGHDYEFLPRQEILSFEEITRVARAFATLGVRKLRLTGGEPLLRREIESLITMLAEIPGIDDLALTTNGLLLAEKAAALRAAGLQRVTVSLPALRDETFARLNGLGHRVADVLAGIEAAEEAGLGPIKINVVVVRGVNEDEIVDIARFFKQRGHIVRFIEYMDVGSVNHWRQQEVLSARRIIERVGDAIPLVELDRKRASDVALRFAYEDDGVEVGAIASVSEPFCGDCSRARITADGQVYTCLFGSQGSDLKALLRGGCDQSELEQAIAAIWRRRSDRYSEERAERRRQPEAQASAELPVEMFRIGG